MMLLLKNNIVFEGNLNKNQTCIIFAIANRINILQYLF